MESEPEDHRLKGLLGSSNSISIQVKRIRRKGKRRGKREGLSANPESTWNLSPLQLPKGQKHAVSSTGKGVLIPKQNSNLVSLPAGGETYFKELWSSWGFMASQSISTLSPAQENAKIT